MNEIIDLFVILSCSLNVSLPKYVLFYFFSITNMWVEYNSFLCHHILPIQYNNCYNNNIVIVIIQSTHLFSNDKFQLVSRFNYEFDYFSGNTWKIRKPSMTEITIIKINIQSKSVIINISIDVYNKQHSV